jgi:ribosomal protein L15
MATTRKPVNLPKIFEQGLYTLGKEITRAFEKARRKQPLTVEELDQLRQNLKVLDIAYEKGSQAVQALTSEHLSMSEDELLAAIQTRMSQLEAEGEDPDALRQEAGLIEDSE